MKSIMYIAGAFALGYFLGRASVPPKLPAEPASIKVLTRIDTLRVTRPETVFVRELTPVVDRLPLADSQEDSAIVQIPMQQAVYRDSSFTAYVSGYHPRLDSISLYRPVTTVETTMRTRHPRFAFGVSAGYALTPAGPQPYIGVGISLKLWEF